MNARSIWQGMLTIEREELAVKLYSAVQDRSVHFHLLHRRDRARVQQSMVDGETGKPVPIAEARKAVEIEPGVFIAVTAEDFEKSTPRPSRKVVVERFVPSTAIDPRLYERPYYLGPGSDSAAEYFALAGALERKKRVGIATWVMRKHSYVGALSCRDGYLMLIALRHAEEVIPLARLEAPAGARFSAKESALAEKLVEALAGELDPAAYHDEFQERLRALIAAKRQGKKIPRRAAPRRRVTGSLTRSLEASLKGVGAGTTRPA